MEVNMNITKAYSLIVDKLEGWITTLVEMLPNLLMAVLVLLAFYLIARLVRKGASKLFAKVSNNTSLNRLFTTVIYIGIILMGTFVALSVLKLDKTVTSLLAGLGVIGLALGFAFQDTASNFMAGVFLAVRRPFKLNEIVATNDFMGTVVGMNLRNTVIESFQGQEIIIPNKEVFQNPLVNYSSTGKRRVDIGCGISYGDDMEKVQRIAIKAIKELDFVDEGQDVTLLYDGFGDSSVNFTLRFWIKYPDGQASFLSAQSKAMVALKRAFDENDIMIPFPIRTLDFGIRGGRPLEKALTVVESDLKKEKSN